MFKKLFTIFNFLILLTTPLFCQNELESNPATVTLLNLSNKEDLWKIDNFNNIYSFEQLEELRIENSYWGPWSYKPRAESNYAYERFRDFLTKGHFPKLKILSLDYSQGFFIERQVSNGPYGLSFFSFGYVLQSPTMDFSSFAPNLEILSLKGFNFTNEHIHKRSVEGNNDLRDLAKLPLKELDLSGGSFEPEQIEQTSYTTIISLEKLSLNNSKIKTFNFKVFAPNVKHLSLRFTNVNSKDIANISQLPDLIYIDLSSTKIPAGSLKKLSHLPLLQELKLVSTNMTKADFSCLPSTLKELDLSGCELSIASFSTLSTLTQLEKLNLKHIKNHNITDAEHLSLQEALPNCIILK